MQFFKQLQRLMIAGVILLVGLQLYNPSAAQAQGFDCAGVQGLTQSECQALVNLYHSTDGYQWGVRYHSSGWLQSNTPCHWGGVLCENGHVTGLSLILTGLRGPFPSAIGNLPHLQLLNLSDNNLHGPLPAWLGNLSQLRVLGLAGNRFEGAVPASLANLSQLEMLALHDNFLLIGVLPYNLLSLRTIESITYDDTQLCAPEGDDFTNWLLSRRYAETNVLVCGPLPIIEPEVTVVTPTVYTGPIINVIRNGGFELPGPEDVGVAQEWKGYNNGSAHFGWYDEQWEEAIYAGEHSQLLEIYEVHGPYFDRSIAIYQTVEVRPHAEYELTMHVLMRSTAHIGDRNEGYYSLGWGIDYQGREDYHVMDLNKAWQTIPNLPEQAYLGSNNLPQDDREFLKFTRFKTIIHTGENNRITLFIRGVKHHPVGSEVNFNIDEVSLVGPPP